MKMNVPLQADVPGSSLKKRLHVHMILIHQSRTSANAVCNMFCFAHDSEVFHIIFLNVYEVALA